MMTEESKIVYEIEKQNNRDVKRTVRQIKKNIKLLRKIHKTGFVEKSKYNNLVLENLAFKLENLFMCLGSLMHYIIEIDEESHLNYKNIGFVTIRLKVMQDFWEKYYPKFMKDIKNNRW